MSSPAALSFLGQVAAGAGSAVGVGGAAAGAVAGLVAFCVESMAATASVEKAVVRMGMGSSSGGCAIRRAVC